MSIIAQRVDETGFSITFANGLEFARTRAEILAVLAQNNNNRAKAAARLLQELRDMGGADINISGWKIDVSSLGNITDLTQNN